YEVLKVIGNEWKVVEEGQDINTRYTELFSAKPEPVAQYRPGEEPAPTIVEAPSSEIITESKSAPEEEGFWAGLWSSAKSFFSSDEPPPKQEQVEPEEVPANPLVVQEIQRLAALQAAATPEQGAELSFKSI